MKKNYIYLCFSLMLSLSCEAFNFYVILGKPDPQLTLMLPLESSSESEESSEEDFEESSEEEYEESSEESSEDESEEGTSHYVAPVQNQSIRDWDEEMYYDFFYDLLRERFGHADGTATNELVAGSYHGYIPMDTEADLLEYFEIWANGDSTGAIFARLGVS